MLIQPQAFVEAAALVMEQDLNESFQQYGIYLPSRINLSTFLQKMADQLEVSLEELQSFGREQGLISGQLNEGIMQGTARFMETHDNPAQNKQEYLETVYRITYYLDLLLGREEDHKLWKGALLVNTRLFLVENTEAAVKQLSIQPYELERVMDFAREDAAQGGPFNPRYK